MGQKPFFWVPTIHYLGYRKSVQTPFLAQTNRKGHVYIRLQVKKHTNICSKMIRKCILGQVLFFGYLQRMIWAILVSRFGRVVQAPCVAQINCHGDLPMYIYAQKMSYGPKTLFLGVYYS